MKRQRVMIKAALAVILVSLLAGCGSVSTVGNPAGFGLPTGETAFYSAAVETTPVIVAATPEQAIVAGNMAVKNTEWGGGNPLYEIFSVFREYQHPRDNGVVAVDNIYKLLFQVGLGYENAIEAVSELPAPTVISPPFNFGTDPVTYTHASDRYALARDGDTINALITWIWTEGGHPEYGVLEGSFNDTTGDIELNMVELIDYEGDDQDFSIRTFISGNSVSHQFTLKFVKGGTVQDPNITRISMIGSGISKSESADDYYLIKMIDNLELEPYPDGRYFKFASGADEDDLRGMSLTGSSLDEIVDPNNYAATIEGMTFFALDLSDNPTSLDDFSNSTLTLEY